MHAWPADRKRSNAYQVKQMSLAGGEIECSVKGSVLICCSCKRLDLECVIPARKPRPKKSRCGCGRNSGANGLTDSVRGRVDQVETAYVANQFHSSLGVPF